MSLWSVVGGLWSVAGRWAVVLYYALCKHLDELRIFCIEHSPHIICLNEAKITEEFSENKWFSKHYSERS